LEKISKKNPGHGAYKGIGETYNPKNNWHKVVYDDGD